MTRAHPLLHRTALAAVLACVGCNSDDPSQGLTTTSGTTEVDPTEVHVFTTGDPMDTGSTTELPPGEWSCRDAIFCLNQCFLALPMPLPDEPDLSACIDCLEPLSTAEWLNLIRLGECVGTQCYETGVCTPENTGDEPCNNCLFLGLVGTNPPTPGCEAEVLACD